MHIVRRVLSSEYGKYRTHLKALDTDSRILRFAAPVTDDVIDSICDKIESDPQHHVLFAVEDENLDFIAVGHIAVFDDMELAFSVLKEHRGKGIGNQLMKRVIQHCRVNGYLKGFMVCLPHNSAIKHLCKKYGIGVHTEYGESMGDVELAKPDVVTYINEATSYNLGVYDYMSKRTLLPWTILSH